MARKSRRHITSKTEIDISSIEAKYRIPTAAYARLSVEKFEGDTIGTQIDLLKGYIRESDDLTLNDVYVDNGYTGTNFERPEFMRMMEDVQSGKIRCIVVKDLSRFGRNFLETGYYIETLLPKLGARLISINDNFDSSRQKDVESLILPIRNIVNDLYAKDFSKKVSKINESRRRNGTYTIESSLYGYKVDRDNNRFIYNPDTAPTVRLIFRLFIAGHSSADIAGYLNALGIRTPLEYKCETELQKPMTGKRLWDSDKVRMILMREEYMGDRCLGRKIRAMYRNYENWKVPKDQWTIYKDDHEPLVTREDWNKANEILQSIKDRKQSLEKWGDINPHLNDIFGCRVWCRSCGRHMYLETKKGETGTVSTEAAAYVCKGRTGPDDKSGCYNRIELDTLRMIVTSEIRMLSKLTIDQDRMLKAIKKKQNNNNPLYRCKTQMRELMMELSENADRSGRLYEEYSDGIVDADDYMIIKKKYQDRRKMLEEKLHETKLKLKQTEDKMATFGDIADRLRELSDHIHLDRELMDLLIEKVVVDADRNVEVVFKCRDVFADVADMLKGGDKA